MLFDSHRIDPGSFMQKDQTYDNNLLFRYLVLIMLVGALIAFIFNMDKAIESIVWQGEGKGAIFPDFSESVHVSSDLNPYTKDAVYPPLVYLILYPLHFLIPGIDQFEFVDNVMLKIIFLSIFIIFFSFFCIAARKNTQLDRRTYASFVILVLLSAPMLCSIERGNMVIIAWSLAAISILTYNTEKPSLISILCLALAINFKPYLIVLSLLYLIDKRHREFLYFVLISGLLFFLPLTVMGGLDGLELFLKNMINLENFNQGVEETFGFGFKIGLENTIWVASHLLSVDIHESGIHVLKIVLSAGLLFSAVYSKHRWESVTSLFLLFLILSNISWIYNGIYFSIPLLLLINEYGKTGKYTYYLILLYLLLVLLPYGYAIVGLPGGNQISYSSAVCSISLLMLTLSLISGNIIRAIRSQKTD